MKGSGLEVVQSQLRFLVDLKADPHQNAPAVLNEEGVVLSEVMM